jgi:hypothetical protein
MFSGRGKLLRIALLFVALVILGVVQWQVQKSKREKPLFGTIRVIVVPGKSETTSCGDWRLDVYLENGTSYEIKLDGYTIHTSIGGDEEQTARRGELSTTSDNPMWSVGPAKQTRIWHAEDGCTRWASRGAGQTGPVQVQYKATVYTSDGIYTGIAGTKVAIRR